jgi:hypothetical protein
MHKTSLVTIKFFFIIAFAAGMLTGCDYTEGSLKIKGKVKDENTQTGIPGKHVIVQGLVYSNNKFVPVEAGQFSTNSTGCFTYTLRKIKDSRNYKFCFVGDSDHLFTTHEITLLDLNKNAEFLSFPLKKLVDITIRLNRKSKNPACDTLRLVLESDGVYGGFLYPCKINNLVKTKNSFGFKPGTDLIWIGGFVNSTISTKVFADKKTILSWELYRNGRRKEFTDTVICKRDFENIVSFTY